MSLGIKKESIDDIRSSNDNLNQNLTEININEEKIIENNVEVTLTVKVNISKDNKDNSSTNVDKDTLKDVNEIDKGKSSLVNEDEEDKLNNTNEIDKPKQRILVCVGVPGSGKSTFSKKLCQVDHIWHRVNQDDLGSRRACEDILRSELKKGKNVIVDRCNFDREQRNTWVKIAHHHKLQIDAIILDTPFEICEKRILRREDHPTQVHGTKGINILESFKQLYKVPNYNEGFERILFVKPQEINDCNEDDIKKVMRKLDEIPKRDFKPIEREGRGRGRGRPHRGRGGGNYGRENYQGKNYGGSGGNGGGNSSSGDKGNAWENRGNAWENRGSARERRGNAWESRGRGENRGSARGGNNHRGNYDGSNNRGGTWGNKGRENNNNNSNNGANPHYNSNFPPLEKK